MGGLALILIIIFFGGTLGLPMGMPPGPEDPMMSKMAPDECLFYASWSGVAELDPDANPTEKWMSQPKTSQAIPKFRHAFRKYVLAMDTTLDPASRLSNRILTYAVNAGMVNPVGLYVDRLDAGGGRIEFKAAILVDLGKNRNSAAKQFDELYQMLTEEQNRLSEKSSLSHEAISIDELEVIRITTAIRNMPIYLAIDDKYLMMGVGEKSLDRLMVNMNSPAPDWLVAMKERLAVDRVSSVAFCDLERAKSLLSVSKFDAWMGLFVEDMIQDTKKVGWVSGLDAKGFLTRSELITPKQTKGILSVIDRAPIHKDYLKEIPAGTTIGLATRISSEDILRLVKDAARNASQEAAVNESLQEFQKLTGVSLEEELLAAVGDFVYVYYDLDLQNWEKGWVISVRIEDEMSFPGIFSRLNQGLEQWSEASDQWSYKVVTEGLHEIHSVSSQRNQRNDLAWSVVDEQWYFSRSSDDIVKHIQGQPKENRYLSQAAVQEIFEFGDKQGFGGPIAMSHLNFPDLLQAARPFVGGWLDSDEEIYPKTDFRWSDLPSIDELINDVDPSFLAIYRTEQGFQMLQRQTYPGASPGVTAAAVATAALPYQLGELANRRNLVRISSAHLAFEAKHKHLCAAYSTDANGNKLLSWRVHLLPFLGYDDLYQQFRLDEPWSSAHNFALADKMPEVYQHSSMRMDDNKTVYMVPTHDGAAFGVPQDTTANPPLGLKMEDITDAAANTIMVFQMNRQHQTDWTKPEDCNADGKAMEKKIVPSRKQTYKFYVALVNGDVRKLNNWAGKVRLDRLIKRADGSEVSWPMGF